MQLELFYSIELTDDPAHFYQANVAVQQRRFVAYRKPLIPT